MSLDLISFLWELVEFLLKPSEGLGFVSRPGEQTHCRCGDGSCA